MSKILLCGDIHVHSHKQSYVRLQECLDVLDWMFEQAEKHDIGNIIFLGDLFHTRQTIQVLSYQKTFDIFLKWHERFNKIYLLLGNHDLWFSERWDISSVSPFKAIKNVTVIDSPATYNISGIDIDFLPYTKNPLKSMKDFKAKSRVLCGHLALDGAELNSFNSISDVSIENDGDMVKVDADSLTGWEKVFLGHYHKPQRLNQHVEYVGSPLQLEFGEAFQEKHLVLFDPSNFDIKYIVNDFSKKHLKIPFEAISKHDLNNNYVEIIVDDIGESGLIDLKKSIANNYQVETLEIRQSKKTKDKDMQTMQDVKNVFHNKDEEVLKKFIKIKEPKLDDDKLLKIGQMLTQEA